MHAITGIFDFMNFMLFIVKFIKFKPIIKFLKKFKLHKCEFIDEAIVSFRRRLWSRVVVDILNMLFNILSGQLTIITKMLLLLTKSCA